MREPAKTFECLLVWQKTHLFVLAYPNIFSGHSEF